MHSVASSIRLVGWLLQIALLFAACVPAVRADAWPTRPVRLVVPFAAGSATDAMARVLAQALSARLGQNVVVDNRAGAFGQIAAVHVARAAPDGYTLFVTTNTTHSANPHLYRTLPYDPLKDFLPVARTATLPFMLVVGQGAPARTAREWLEQARARPGEITFATASSTSLVAARTAARLAGVQLTAVPYKASPQAVLDVAGGQVQCMFADFATAMPLVQSGRLRVLAVATAGRSPLLPEAPPLAETIPGFEVGSWNGVFAPAGTPREIVARLGDEVLHILATPDVRDRLAALGFEVAPLGPEALDRYVREQLQVWGRMIRDAGIAPE